MAEVKWTGDQQSAIEHGGHNIIVSAAAGSGKTAVLVERIKRKIYAGVDIDSMLVVTFTNAAAAEMKEKIIKSLRESDMDHAARQRQLRLISGADICTIDAFCLQCVKNHTHDLNISPDFKLCEPAEDSLICAEAADILIDGLYNRRYEDKISYDEFIRLTEKYSSINSDDRLKSLILEIYSFIQPFAEPMEWLDEAAAEYENEVFGGKWAAHALKRMREAAEYALNSLYALTEEMYAECGFEIEDMSAALKAAAECEDEENDALYLMWGVLIKEICGFERLLKKAADGGGVSGREAWDRAYALYNDALNRAYCPYKLDKDRKAKTLHEDWIAYRDEYRDNIYGAFINDCERAGLSQSADETEEQIRDAAHDMRAVSECVRLLSEIIGEIKKKRAVYSFSDIEHMAHTLFKDKETAQEYRSRYSEILIDEYQDTNGLQDDIFRRVAEGDGSKEPVPIFMVGDLKQSIYAFRGGDPNIFKQKSAAYDTGKDGERIVLSKNFRSSPKILEAVNEIFENVMSDVNGDVEYKGREMLYAGREDFDEELPKPETVLLPVFKNTSPDSGEDMERERIEAKYVARRIREMVDNGEIVGSSGGSGGHPVRYSDITVLSSAVSSISDIYKEEFARMEIPLSVQGEGYFSLREIRTMLSLIKVLINRRRDVALISVMRSPIGGFSDDDIARLHLMLPRDNMSAALERAAERESGGLGEKARLFVSRLDRWEGYMRYKPVASLILDIYSETGFYNFLGALDGAEQAQANLRLFYERAKKYEESGFKGLFKFVNYIEKLEAAEAKSDGASLISENHNVVRMMTIHKSKGLEFPVVFLVSAGKQFGGSRGADWAFNKNAGIGLRYINGEEKYSLPTIALRYIEDENSREQHSEDLRKLYVGLTRPKERLIITAVKNYADEKKLDGEKAKWKRDFEFAKDNPELYSAARGFFDWIMPVMYSCAQKWDFHEEDTASLRDADIYSVLSYEYPYAALSALPSKTTVTAIKSARMSMEQISESDSYDEEREINSGAQGYMPVILSMKPEPECLRPLERAANLIGTAYHQVMAFIEPEEDMDEGYVREQVSRIRAMGEISAEDEKDIDPKVILGFFEDESGIGSEFIKAYQNGRLHREAPFEIAIEPDIYSPELCRGDDTEWEQDDMMLLQGTIDCYFEDENGDITIIDYKTDRMRAGEDTERFIKRKKQEYGVQLELYARAVKMLGKNIKNKFLYLFSVKSVVQLEENSDG